MIFCLSAFCKIFAALPLHYDTANITSKTLPQPPSEIYTGNDFKYDEPSNEPNFFERLWVQIKKAIVRFLNKL
ncbi:MAG: hypothetical protein LBB41_03850, partial [Prevotellaceae bacterium]|nr:hypothetical protein [Prevotellaceae bacterium]